MAVLAEARMPTPGASSAHAKPRVTRLHPVIAAEVRGLDLSEPLDDEAIAFVRKAFAENIVLVFRDQDLTPQDQKRFASYFGPVAERLKPPDPSRAGNSPNWDELMIISNEVDRNGKPLGSLGDGEMWFHTDKCYVERPHRASFLYALELPSEGGHTKFSSLCEAWDRLPAAMKARLEGRMVMQGHEYGVGRRLNIDAPLDKIHHHRQPLVVTNPDSGRKGIYVSSQNTMWIEGMERADSEALLDELFGLVEAPDIVYEHVWQDGDLVMWDNLSCLHARTDWPKEQVRKLRRCTVIGEKLF